jgi:glycosyltransferase involved in cell wall biosynthesis
MADILLSTGSRKQIYEGIAFGEAHYSYNIVFQRFKQAIASCLGYEPRVLLHPEIYKTVEAKRSLGIGKEKPIHIAFKSPEELRLLDGAYNIAHVAWEFNKLPSYPDKRSGPLDRPLRALGIFDEIWVGCEFTKQVFIREGLSNVHVIPAPIPLPQESIKKSNILDVIGQCNALQLDFNGKPGVLKRARTELNPFSDIFTTYYGDVRPKIYLTVANIWDYRKNIPNLVKLFEEFHSRHRDTALVIKLVLDNKNTCLNNVNEIFALHFSEWVKHAKSDGVFFISDKLSDESMTALLRTADFYLNLSRAEGQCLPILEAMALGVLPISVDHTAMADYINTENAFVVKSKEVELSPSTPYPQEGLTWYEFDESDALVQLEDAYQASDILIKNKSRNCIELIHQFYSFEVVSRIISSRFTKLTLGFVSM